MNDTQLQTVNYAQAVLCKKHGFDWVVVTHYYKDGTLIDFPEDVIANWNESDILASAPTVALALKWYRDVMNIKYNINHIYGYLDTSIWQYTILPSFKFEQFNTYDLAESALLDAVQAEIERRRKQ